MQPGPITTLLLVLGLASPPLRADEPAGTAAPPSGARVRFETATERRETATVVKTDGDALVVRLSRNSAVVRVPLADIRSLQVSTGLRSHANVGAIVGAIPGILFGGFLGMFAACYESECDAGGVPAAAVGALIVGTLTALVGAAIGALTKTERWQSFSLPRAEIQLGPTPQDGLAFALKVSF